MRRFYGTTPGGLVGNDDVGQMSAWLVFAMLGFYPAQPFSGDYVLGRPMVEATLHLAGEKVMRLRGHGDWVQLNGSHLKMRRLSHADLMAGGELRWGQVNGQTP